MAHNRYARLQEKIKTEYIQSQVSPETFEKYCLIGFLGPDEFAPELLNCVADFDGIRLQHIPEALHTQALYERLVASNQQCSLRYIPRARITQELCLKALERPTNYQWSCVPESYLNSVDFICRAIEIIAITPDASTNEFDELVISAFFALDAFADEDGEEVKIPHGESLFQYIDSINALLAFYDENSLDASTFLHLCDKFTNPIQHHIIRLHSTGMQISQEQLDQLILMQEHMQRIDHKMTLNGVTESLIVLSKDRPDAKPRSKNKQQMESLSL